VGRRLPLLPSSKSKGQVDREKLARPGQLQVQASRRLAQSIGEKND